MLRQRRAAVSLAAVAAVCVLVGTVRALDDPQRSTLRTNDAPLPPEDNRFEIQVAPGVSTEGKMRRGCYNRPQSGLNAFNICLREFPEDLDSILPMEVDIDRDPLRFIIIKEPERGTFLRVDPDSGLFSYMPNDGVTAEWDSFKYYITDCPPGCQPGEGNCPNKDPPDCSNTVDVEVTVRIGDPTGMRAKGKTYNMWEDLTLQNNWIDPTTGKVNTETKVELQRSTFAEAGWSTQDAENTPLRWWIVTPPQHGSVIVLGCNDTDTSACQDETIPFIYTPEPNYFGQDNFTYRVEDRNASRPNSDLDGTVTINIMHPNNVSSQGYYSSNYDYCMRSCSAWMNYATYKSGYSVSMNYDSCNTLCMNTTHGFRNDDYSYDEYNRGCYEGSYLYSGELVIGFGIVAVIGIVATILLITTLSLGSLGIHIAKQWPEPSCCCYTGTLGNGRMAGCHDLARINLAFFIIQIIVAVLFVFMAASTSIFAAGLLPLFYWFFTILHVIAIFVTYSGWRNMKAAYAMHGRPAPRGAVPITANRPAVAPSEIQAMRPTVANSSDNMPRSRRYGPVVVVETKFVEAIVQNQRISSTDD